MGGLLLVPLLDRWKRIQPGVSVSRMTPKLLHENGQYMTWNTESAQTGNSRKTVQQWPSQAACSAALLVSRTGFGGCGQSDRLKTCPMTGWPQCFGILRTPDSSTQSASCTRHDVGDGTVDAILVLMAHFRRRHLTNATSGMGKRTRHFHTSNKAQRQFRICARHPAARRREGGRKEGREGGRE